MLMEGAHPLRPGGMVAKKLSAVCEAMIHNRLAKLEAVVANCRECFLWQHGASLLSVIIQHMADAVPMQDLMLMLASSRLATAMARDHFDFERC